MTTLNVEKDSDPQPVDVAGCEAVIEQQVRRLITAHPLQTPVHTTGGKWDCGGDGWAPAWTAGFLAGLVWTIADRTLDPWWRERAEAYTLHVAARQFDTGTHDIGFLFTPSWGRWHAVAPDQRMAETLVNAGRTMAGRFKHSGRYLSTWVDEASTFIDIMMNLDIVFQAAELSGDQELTDIAVAHAATTRRYLVRGDASTAHEGWFNPQTGAFERTATHQGYRSDSCWARGQAWAIYGFATCYERTHLPEFLDTAMACADLYMDRTGTRYVPPNDWDDPEPAFPYEASAASVTAAALLKLSEIAGVRGPTYFRYAKGILSRLSQPDFLADPADGWEGIVRQTTYHTVHGLGVQESTMWGDYFFAEAIERYVRLGPRHQTVARRAG